MQMSPAEDSSTRRGGPQRYFIEVVLRGVVREKKIGGKADVA
jgi:hypothetical protein